jgi:hypothetical protein
VLEKRPDLYHESDAREVDLAVCRVAARVRVSVSAHFLRLMFATGLVRSDNHIVLIAELAGTGGLTGPRRHILSVLQGRPSEAYRTPRSGFWVGRAQVAAGGARVVRRAALRMGERG